MKRRDMIGISAMVAIGFALLPTGAVTQQESLKEQLVGTWTLVSTTGRLPDGGPTWA